MLYFTYKLYILRISHVHCISMNLAHTSKKPNSITNPCRYSRYTLLNYYVHDWLQKNK